MKLKKLPKHISFIMDGNRRWANLNKFPLDYAYKKGLENLVRICKKLFYDLNIPFISLFAFSKQNWKRNPEEIGFLFHLMNIFFIKNLKSLKKNQVRIVVSGRIKELPIKNQKIINLVLKKTQENSKYVLNIAINYSGRDEIIYTINKILKKQNQQGEFSKINKNFFKKNLFHPEIPYPDFLIRTSGEKRLSNFFLWQLAYTEIYFTSTLWPDFSKKELYIALKDYENRKRRFGGK